MLVGSQAERIEAMMLTTHQTNKSNIDTKASKPGEMRATEVLETTFV